MSTPVFEMAILGRATWNLHSLNNEGTVGNVSEPRTVVLADGRKSDAVSGEMLKHIHAQNLWLTTLDNSFSPANCAGYSNLNEPTKAPTSTTSRKKPRVTQGAFSMRPWRHVRCAICTGFSLQAVNSALVHIDPAGPSHYQSTSTAIITFMRYVVEGRGVARNSASEDGEEAGGAAAQMVYHWFGPAQGGTHWCLFSILAHRS